MVFSGINPVTIKLSWQIYASAASLMTYSVVGLRKINFYLDIESENKIVDYLIEYEIWSA